MRRMISLGLVFAFLVWLVACSHAPTSSYPGGAGQVPAANDKDGDGIPDDWETKGVDYTYPVDGSKHHLDLQKPPFSASPEHKDIFVWVVWMEDRTHTHRPDPEALAIVESAFANSPVANIDGFPGINLHIILGPDPVPEVQQIGSVDTEGEYDWVDFNKIKDKYFPKELEGIFYFCIFAHDIDPQHNSGITKNIPGRDMIVSLGGFTNQVGTRQEKAGTFMHELGHALGLRHGGADDNNFKPNYISVMNYFFQLNGIPINGQQGNYDYSRFKLDCSEERLNENIGLTTDPKLLRYGTQFYCCQTCSSNHGHLQSVLSISSTQVDWNCDGAFQSSVATDINGDKEVTDLSGYDDWASVILKPSATSAAGVTPRSGIAGLKPAAELTPLRADTIRLFPVTHVSAARRGRSIFVTWTPIPLERVLAYRVYRSSSPASKPEQIGTVADTEHPSFTDVVPPSGPVQYFATAVYAPHAFAVQTGASQALAVIGDQQAAIQNPLPAVAHTTKTGIVLSPSREITHTDQITAIRESAPQKAADYAALGQMAAPSAASKAAFFPRAVFETDLAPSASVVVK